MGDNVDFYSTGPGRKSPRSGASVSRDDADASPAPVFFGQLAVQLLLKRMVAAPEETAGDRDRLRSTPDLGLITAAVPNSLLCEGKDDADDAGQAGSMSGCSDHPACDHGRTSPPESTASAPGSLNLVDVPTEAWLPLVKAALQPALYPKLSLGRADARSRFSPQAGELIVLDLADGKKLSSDTIGDLAGHLEVGGSVAICARNVRVAVPTPIERAADRRFRMAKPDQEWLNDLIRLATGMSFSVKLAPSNFARLEPWMLLFAQRGGQSPQDYIARLIRLMSPPKASEDAERVKSHRGAGQTLRLDDLHGMPEVVAWAKALATDLSLYKAGQLEWDGVDRGALLAGPPGVGKTTVARAIADYCGVEFVATSFASWQSSGEGHLGDTLQALKDAFGEARQKSPAVMLIDELDSLGSREDYTRASQKRNESYWISVVNGLLEQLDGASNREGIVVIAATNHPDRIDPAIRRAGRLDREIHIRLPNAQALADIFGVYLGGAVPNAELQRCGNLALGCTGADVSLWVRGAQRLAREQRRPVEVQDVLGQIAGPLPAKGDPDAWRVALHEAGHAVAQILLIPGPPPALRLKNSGGRLEGASMSSAMALGRMTAADLDREIVSNLSGRAAEEVLIGRPATGAALSRASDLALATRLASMLEVQFGMGGSGLAWTDILNDTGKRQLLVGRPGAERRVRLRLARSYRQAMAIASANSAPIKAVADALLKRMVLTSAEVGLLAGIPMRPSHSRRLLLAVRSWVKRLDATPSELPLATSFDHDGSN